MGGSVPRNTGIFAARHSRTMVSIFHRGSPLFVISLVPASIEINGGLAAIAFCTNPNISHEPAPIL